MSFILLQLVGVGLVLLSSTTKHMQLGCGLLAAKTLLYFVTFPILWKTHFFIRLMSKIGELALLLAETVAEKKSIYAGVPSRGDDPKEKQYLQLSGRILLVFMFMNLVNSSSAQGIYEAVGTPLVIILGLPLVLCVAVGYKTKLVSVILICALVLHNINRNQFWTWGLPQNQFDFKKNEFFIVLSIIGGVIHLLVYGAGGISVDQRLKSE